VTVTLFTSPGDDVVFANVFLTSAPVWMTRLPEIVDAFVTFWSVLMLDGAMLLL
jgi:hypothetical protein